MSSNHNKALIIGGMHRSGTSMVASLLKSAGLDLGQRLMPSAKDNNARGFYENLDFVEWHEKVLSSQGVSRFGWTLEENIAIPPQHLRQADELLEKNKKDQLWGWKDPRTTLFLDFWAEKVPQAVFVFPYRPPWEVIDSLYRRGDEMFQSKPVLALQSWMHYNRKCLEFYKAHPNRAVLVSLNVVIKTPGKLIDLLNSKFDLKLAPPEQNLIEKDLLKNDVSNSHRPRLIQRYFPEAVELLKQLDEASLSDGHKYETTIDTEDEAALAEFILEDWMAARKAELDLKKSNQTLYEARSQLYHTKQRLEHLERSRIWKLRSLLQRFRRHVDA